MDMQEQTVVVTGGASGIGKATAFLLARQGARVLIGDIDEAGGRIAAAEGAAERFAIDYLMLDLADQHPRALPGQQKGGGLADARRTTGDNDGLLLHIHR